MTTNNLGVVPKLLPVTATFALPLALLNTTLQANAIKTRFATSTPLGSDASTSLSSNPATRESVVKDGATGEYTINDPLLVATTMHSNFIENAPLAILFGAFVELNGGDRRMLAGVMGLFTLARISHAVGINGGMAMLRARQFGFFASSGVLVGLSSWGMYLVKGYWGL